MEATLHLASHPPLPKPVVANAEVVVMLQETRGGKC